MTLTMTMMTSAPRLPQTEVAPFSSSQSKHNYNDDHDYDDDHDDDPDNDLNDDPDNDYDDLRTQIATD